MSGNSNDRAAYLNSLSVASSATGDVFVRILSYNNGNLDAPQVKAARESWDTAHTAFLVALKQDLVNNNSFTQKIKTELDAITGDIKNKLQGLKNVSEAIQLLDNLVKLATSLASAFA